MKATRSLSLVIKKENGFMRKLLMTLAAMATIVSAGSFTDRADAMTAANPAGIRAALDDVAMTDQVHCVPGWLHHRWWNGRPHSSGCYRGHVVGPRVFIGPRVYHGRRFYGGRHFRGGHRVHVGRHFHGGRHWR
jgi:hypothetical protein